MWIPICLMTLFLSQDDNIDVQESLRVEFVSIDVLALDNKGQPVTDLKLSDFEVKEKRKKVQITLFEKLDLRTASQFTFTPPASLESGDPKNEPPVQQQHQQIILALDMEDVDLVDANKTFDQLKEFVENLDRLVPYSVDVYSLEYGSISKGFTSDRSLILDAIEQLRSKYFDTQRGRGGSSLLGGLSGRDGRTRSQGTGSFTKLEEELRRCKQVKSESCTNSVVGEFFENHWMRTSRVLGELESLSEKFTSKDGLKTMILVSPGFAVDGLGSILRLWNIVMGGTGEQTIANLSTGHFQSGGLREKYKALLHACLVRRVIFNVIDIYNGSAANSRGSSARFTGNTRAAEDVYLAYSREVSSGTSSLAKDTGGSFYSTFRLGTPITKVVETSRFYYQIGYTSPEGKAGKWRKIKIKCKRKGVKLRYRDGYYGR